MSPVPNYTPGWRETKWSKVPCLRKQPDGRGLYPPPLPTSTSGVRGVNHSATHASFNNPLIYSASTNLTSIFTKSITSCPAYNTEKLTNYFSCLTVEVNLQIFVNLSARISKHLIRRFKLARIFAFAFILHHVCSLRRTNWKNWEKVSQLTSTAFPFRNTQV